MNAYRSDEYVIVTDANLEEFQMTLKRIKVHITNWDIYMVAESLEQEYGRKAEVVKIAYNF